MLQSFGGTPQVCCQAATAALLGCFPAILDKNRFSFISMKVAYMLCLHAVQLAPTVSMGLMHKKQALVAHSGQLLHRMLASHQ